MKRKVARVILAVYLVAVIWLRIQGGNVWGGNYTLLFPVGILLPRSFASMERLWKVLAAGLVLFGWHGIFSAAAGILAGYCGYFLSSEERMEKFR